MSEKKKNNFRSAEKTPPLVGEDESVRTYNTKKRKKSNQKKELPHLQLDIFPKIR
jgi:hypothetical protein